MRRTLHQITALSAIALSACSDTSRLAGPGDLTSAPRPSASISDAAHQGISGFYFLPPLVAEPHDTGVFDPNRAVTVTVCPLGNPAADTCVGAAVTVSPPQVDVNGNHYQVNWQTDVAAFPADQYYRISVVDNQTHGTWGHVDVFLGSTGKGFHSIDQTEFTPLLDGRTVPIKFRIDGGAQAPIIAPVVNPPTNPPPTNPPPSGPPTGGGGGTIS